MLLLTDIIQDEEMGAAPFVILREHYVFSEGEPVLESTEAIETSGVVQPTRESDLSLVPEEYRSETLLTFYSPVRFSLGSRPDPTHSVAPDRIRYADRSFLVVSVKDWLNHGFSRAIAIEKEA